MSFDPGSIISLIQTCQTLYEYYNDVKQSSAERRRLLDEVVSLQSGLEALGKLVNVGDPGPMEQLAQLLDSSQPFHETLRKTLTDVETVLSNGAPKVKAKRWKVLWGRLVAALWWTADKAEVKALLSDLERHKSRITLALQHDMFKKQDDLEGKLDNMNHHISNEDRLRMAEFISASDYSGHRVDLLETGLSGTGSWMMECPEFVEWRDNSDFPGTLWCYGYPGAGKSVMAALIVEHLQSTSNIVLSVFCRYTSDTFTTPFPVLRGLLRQLIEKTTKVPSALCDLYWSKTTPHPDSLPRILAELAEVQARPVYIVIDALDECDIGVDLVRAIQQLGPLFRILVTSRPIFREIYETPSIQIRAADDDILAVVDATLSRLMYAWLDEELKEMIREQVVDKADGMFLLAALQLRELEYHATCRRDVLSILDSLPRTLDDAYKLTFQRIRQQGERKNMLVCGAVALITLRWPFWGGEVQHLLAEGDETQETDFETLLQCCRGLVDCDHFGAFSFIHYSVYEYTASHWSELFPENPNMLDFCLKLGYSTLTRPGETREKDIICWDAIVDQMQTPEELDQVISLISTPAAIEALSMFYRKLEYLSHDPLLIACQCGYWRVMQYLIQTAPPDSAERFYEAIDACKSQMLAEKCSRYIRERPDMRADLDRRRAAAAEAKLEALRANESLELTAAK